MSAKLCEDNAKADGLPLLNVHCLTWDALKLVMDQPVTSVCGGESVNFLFLPDEYLKPCWCRL